VVATTLENYHGAHGKYETEAPVRAFVTYPLKGKSHLLAAYLPTSSTPTACTSAHASPSCRG
jgi:hypothetical protein